jgi:hypothetical protein
MKQHICLLLLLPVMAILACTQAQQPAGKHTIAAGGNTSVYKSIGDIPLPKGYTRVPAAPGSFGAWLRKVALKTDKTVYLYNGEPKRNQEAQFAVLDIAVGKKDLQQCADAVMRLYAEYQFTNARYGQIVFSATDGSMMDYNSWMQGYRFSERNNRLVKQQSAAASSGHTCLDRYLENVFAWAGTLSLSHDLKAVTDIRAIEPGNVFIKGGSPGHAVIVADVAVNTATGDKLFLLAQSYMPAQDIHLLVNPGYPNAAAPWYSADIDKYLYTPEWTFTKDQLKKFPEPLP